MYVKHLKLKAVNFNHCYFVVSQNVSLVYYTHTRSLYTYSDIGFFFKTFYNIIVNCHNHDILPPSLLYKKDYFKL